MLIYREVFDVLEVYIGLKGHTYDGEGKVCFLALRREFHPPLTSRDVRVVPGDQRMTYIRRNKKLCRIWARSEAHTTLCTVRPSFHAFACVPLRDVLCEAEIDQVFFEWQFGFKARSFSRRDQSYLHLMSMRTELPPENVESQIPLAR